MAITVKPGNVLLQQPGNSMIYSFGVVETEIPHVNRIRPAGSGDELDVCLKNGAVCVSGGIDGARYGLSWSDGRGFEVRVTSAAPEEALPPADIIDIPAVVGQGQPGLKNFILPMGVATLIRCTATIPGPASQGKQGATLLLYGRRDQPDTLVLTVPLPLIDKGSPSTPAIWQGQPSSEEINRLSPTYYSYTVQTEDGGVMTQGQVAVK